MKKGLGRGFDSLIPTNLIDEEFDPTAEQDDKISRLRTLGIDEIMPDPGQPRRYFDEAGLKELAESIRIHGVLQPLVVTPHGKKFSIVAGERRWRASRLAGLDKVPVLVRTVSGQHRLELSLIENLQRRDLNPLETATAYIKLRDQFNLTLEEIGERVGGKSVSAISNTMRLLKLPKVVQEAIFRGELSEGQARPLIGLEDSVAEEVMQRTIKEGWSVRRIEQAIAELKKPHRNGPVKVVEQSYTKDIDRLQTKFNTKVKIQAGSKGAGKIIIPFKNNADFERIRQLLG